MPAMGTELKWIQARYGRMTLTVSVRHLLAVTTTFVFGLILLGVYVGAAGAGLACGAAWPFCDGMFGLFPANWPSFLEWFHRLVAMVTGFLVIGTTYAVWKTSEERIVRYGALFATVLLPVQILLGANTVLNFGIWATMVHHTAAQLIFGSLVVATTASFLSARTMSEHSTDAAHVDARSADD